MKKIVVVFLLSFFVCSAAAQEVKNVSHEVNGGTKKENGKAFLTDYFRQTYEALEQSVAGLTAEQLNYKQSADKWSINQCLEHMVLTERMLFDEAKKGMQAPASPKRRKDVKVADEDVIKGISDRSHKVKAPDALVGKGKYSDVQQALSELKADRKFVYDYLNTRPLNDLRNHVNDTPFGATDGYHSFLYIAGHTARHTGQIEEIKADPGFPK